MALLIDNTTQVIIQGMTGKEGQRALKWMTAAGTKVVAGVTPGKGGQEVEGVPVYNSVQEALAKHPQATVSCIYVPPKFVLAAAKESLTAGIKLLHVLGEGVPSKDTAEMLEAAAAAGARILGPSSIGAVSPGKGSLGSMGGGDMSQYIPPGKKGGVVILSKSGGMANTIATMLSFAKIPQTSVIGIGGDRLIGTTFADLLPDMAADDETAAVVIVGEIGGAYEEVFAEQIIQQKFKKPVIAFISGLFAETLPAGVAFGHAGAIVSKTEGTRDGKIAALKQSGALLAETPSEIIPLLQKAVPKL